MKSARKPSSLDDETHEGNAGVVFDAGSPAEIEDDSLSKLSTIVLPNGHSFITKEKFIIYINFCKELTSFSMVNFKNLNCPQFLSLLLKLKLGN